MRKVLQAITPARRKLRSFNMHTKRPYNKDIIYNKNCWMCGEPYTSFARNTLFCPHCRPQAKKSKNKEKMEAIRREIGISAELLKECKAIVYAVSLERARTPLIEDWANPEYQACLKKHLYYELKKEGKL